MNRDNDLLRAADQALRNAERLQAWRRKWIALFGHDPDRKNLRSVESYFEEMRRCLTDAMPARLDRDDSPLCFADDIIAPGIETAQTIRTNAHIIPFPRRRMQIMHAELPRAPEPAA